MPIYGRNGVSNIINRVSKKDCYFVSVFNTPPTPYQYHCAVPGSNSSPPTVDPLDGMCFPSIFYIFNVYLLLHYHEYLWYLIKNIYIELQKLEAVWFYQTMKYNVLNIFNNTRQIHLSQIKKKLIFGIKSVTLILIGSNQLQNI